MVAWFRQAQRGQQVARHVDQRDAQHEDVVLRNTHIQRPAQLRRTVIGMRGEHALGRGFGTAREEQRGHVVAFDEHFRLVRGAGQQFFEGHPARRAVCAGAQLNELPHASQFTHDGRHIAQQGIFDEEPLGLRKVDQVLHVWRLQHEVDRHQPGADLVQRVAKHEEFDAVARERGHLVALGDAALREVVRYGVGHAVELGVGDAAARAVDGVVDDRGLVRRCEGRTAQFVTEVLAAQQVHFEGVCHGLSPLFVVVHGDCQVRLSAHVRIRP